MVGSLQDSSRLRRTFGTYLNSTRLLAEHVVERLVTFCYHESLQRNTIEPVNRIIAASNNEARSRLLQEWADLKAEESKYIQIAVCPSADAQALRSDRCSREGSCLQLLRRV
jgi:hypothetical protein